MVGAYQFIKVSAALVKQFSGKSSLHEQIIISSYMCVYVMDMGEKGVQNSRKLILFKFKDKYTD